jgi:hypothetical protein
LRRRRRRLWRYVSPRRRGRALLLLAALLAGVYAYWYFTNDARVRRLAEDYLRDLTGGDVRIGSAEFSLFGRLELEDVTVRVPGDNSPYPLLRAPKVVLSHRPGALLSGRLQPTEIVCIDPAVAVEYYGETGEANNLAALARLSRQSRGREGEAVGEPPPLPTIRVSNCVLRSYRGPARRPLGEMTVGMSLVPAGEGSYRVVVEEEGTGEAGRRLLAELMYNVAKGEPTGGEVSGEILDVARALPPEYAEWVKAHFTEGRFKTTWRGPDSREPAWLELSNAAMVLPEELGQLRLEDVSGRIRFEAARLTFEDLTGRLAQEGGGRFTVNGRYDGYEADRPFEFTVKLADTTIPRIAGRTELLRDLAQAEEDYRPRGRVSLEMTVRRSADGKLDVAGTAKTDSMAVLYKWFPYPLEQLRGELRFTAEEVVFEGLEARQGPGRFVLSGRVGLGPRAHEYDVLVTAKDLPVDETLRAALNPGMRAAWKELAPAGRANVTARVRRRTGEAEHATLTILGGGDLHVRHRAFPYPLRLTGGSVEIVGEDIIMPPAGEAASGGITAENGGMSCRIRGTIRAGDRPSVDVTVEAREIPIDDVLLAALQPAQRKVMETIHAEGLIRRARAHLWQREGDEVLECEIPALVEGLSLRPDAFPYAIGEATCELTVHTRRVVIHRLTGRHGKARIDGAGELIFGGEAAGIVLSASAKDLPLDESLRAALQPAVRRVWDAVQPRGMAHVVVERYAANTPDAPAGEDFDIRLAPTDATVAYRGVPYRFQLGTAGEAPPLAGERGAAAAPVRITPGEVVLRGLESTARGTPRLEHLAGTVKFDDRRVAADLAVTATGLPLDAERIRAFREADVPLADRLKPGGTFDIDLKRLRVEQVAEAATTTRPAAEEAPAATTRPAAPPQWTADGRLALHQVLVAFAGGAHEVTGVAEGTASEDAEGLTIDGRMSSFAVVLEGGRKVSRLQAQLRKRPDGELAVERIAGEAYGGRVEGKAYVGMAAPARYRARVSFEGLKIGELLGGGEGVVTGEAEGNTELSGTAGEAASTRASGKVWLRKAEFSELPILLGMLQVITLTIPGGGTFSEAFIDYHMKGETVVLREIRLGGKTASILGSGRMHLGSRKLAVTLLRGKSGVLPGLEGLEELLRGVLREIVEVRLTGTIDRPQVKTVPLRSVRAVLDTLLRPEGDED